MRIDRLKESVEQIMVTEVVSVSPEESIVSVAELMSDRRMHGLPVIDGNKRVIGIVTERDFFVDEQLHLHLPSFMKFMQKALIPRTLDSEDEESVRGVLALRAQDIMTSPCIVIGAEATLEEAIILCARKHIRTLPVVGKDGMLKGIVTLTGLMISLCQEE